MRHGQALSETVDPKRPLSRVGRDEVERVAGLAVGRKIGVSAIFHSGILRARQTAEILGEFLAPASVQQIAGLLPQDDPTIAKAELEFAESSVMLVGHLPHLNRLAMLLVNGGTDGQIEFSPATMICCSRNGGRWKIAWALAPHAV